MECPASGDLGAPSTERYISVIILHAYCIAIPMLGFEIPIKSLVIKYLNVTSLALSRICCGAMH